MTDGKEQHPSPAEPETAETRTGLSEAVWLALLVAIVTGSTLAVVLI